MTFTGTGLATSGGVINELDFSRNGGDAEFTVTGLSIDADELEQAINDAFFDFGESLQAFLNGIGLSDLSAGRWEWNPRLGGDDTVTMTNADDTYYVDGGTDLVSLGAGDDTVIAYAAFGFSAPGTVSIDGGAPAPTSSMLRSQPGRRRHIQRQTWRNRRPGGGGRRPRRGLATGGD